MNEIENNASFFRFEDLRIYDKSMEYITWLRGQLSMRSEQGFVNDKFPDMPFMTAASAIALNTAEGSSRNKSQFLHYMKMAKSAVRECVVYTEIAHRLDVFGDDVYDYSRNQLMELTKMIGSLISSLQRSVSSSGNVDKEEDIDDNMF